MLKVIKCTMGVLIFTASLSFAHEGHDNVPGKLKSLHGGVVQSGKEMNLEYVVTGTEVKLYPQSHEAEDLLTKDITLSAMAQTPKGKPAPLIFTQKENGLVTQVDFKGSYRLTLIVKAQYKKGRTQEFKIQVENQ